MHKLFKKTSKKDSKKAISKDEKDKDIKETSARVFMAVTLHHRARFSLGASRNDLGRAAYHWGLLLMPEAPNDKCCVEFDVSDSALPDPNTRTDLNPDRNWMFRTKNPVNPVMSGSLLGRVIIGELDSTIPVAHVEKILQSVPLPMKGTEPPQNCVTWTLAALSVLQSSGLAYVFNIDNFAEWALSYADNCMAAPGPLKICNYADSLSS